MACIARYHQRQTGHWFTWLHRSHSPPYYSSVRSIAAAFGSVVYVLTGLALMFALDRYETRAIVSREFFNQWWMVFSILCMCPTDCDFLLPFAARCIKGLER